MSAPAVSGGLSGGRCIPFWTGTEWWCRHQERGVILRDDTAASLHYLTGMEQLMDHLEVPD